MTDKPLPAHAHRIGIDLGGSKIEGILLNAAGAALARLRVATPQGDYVGTLDAITQMVAQLEQGLTAKASVGVGTPGAASLQPGSLGRIKNANSTCLNGQPLQSDLATLLNREVRIANDANCFALSEARDGAAAGLPVVWGVILGTGVGSGIVVKGQVLTGRQAIAGEWGHNALPSAGQAPAAGQHRPHDHQCYCGRHHCVETYLSGPALSLDYQQHTGASLTASEIVRAAEQGDASAEAVLVRYEHRLALALSVVINCLDPDAIVLGGGLSNIARLYENIPKLLPQWVFSDAANTPILNNKHGDASGVRGAAWLFNE